MSEWKKVKLEDISTSIQTGPFGSQLHQSDYSEKGVPVVMPKDIIDGKVDDSSIARVEMHHIQRLSRYTISEGDILYPRRGDVGKCAFISAKQNGWLCGTGCLRVSINQDKANSRFIFFQLQKHDTIGWIENHAIGATMLNLNTSILSNVPIELPTLNTQRRIAEILSRYDSLIENYQRQIKLLEEAAQRLYKEWFVDLHFPGHENTPIIDGIPEGWVNTNINNILTFHRGYDLTHKEFIDGEYPVVGSTSIIGYHNRFKIEGPGIITGRSGSLGKYQLVWENFWPHNTSLYICDFKGHDIYYIYCLLQTIDFTTLNSGGAIPSLNRNTLSSISVKEPPKVIQNAFSNKVKPMFLIKRQRQTQIRNLTEARDRLLPKLMSGDIQVS